jgi:hypothetical protein
MSAGSIYFAICPAGDRVKIGFTYGDPNKRIAALRYDKHYPEPMKLSAREREKGQKRRSHHAPRS